MFLGRFCIVAVLALAAIGLPNASHAVTFRVLHKFRGYPKDGAGPRGSLVMDASGNLYGTTYYGGVGADIGTIFMIAPDGTESVVHSFGYGDAAGAPSAGLTPDTQGNFFGTDVGGTNSCGEVFEYTPGKGEQVLYVFSGAPNDGCMPTGTLLIDNDGTIYGTTQEGGLHNVGTVFKLSKEKETIVHSFVAKRSDGWQPIAGLIMDQSGNLYGTTRSGGGYNECDGAQGCGTIYKIAPDGTESILFRFGDGERGATPFAGLFLDAAGNLVGTTVNGGAYTCANSYGCGTVFQLTPDGKETVLHAFTGKRDGDSPFGTLIADGAGNLFGTTAYGGRRSCGCGTVFGISSDGSFATLFTFRNSKLEGANSLAGLYEDSSGNLYGTTYDGGRNNYGVVFEISP